MPLLPSMALVGSLDHGQSSLFPATQTSSVPGLPTSYTDILSGAQDALLYVRAENLGYDPSFNASAILARRQQYQLQAIASTFSSVSLLAAICAVYWFCMMRRNFRRDLVLLLILGDFWKSAWFLVFSSTSLADGYIYTESSFCQASGYFLQLGLEACDCAIFLMSLHMSLQIFPPARSFLGHDGLYRIRYYVVAGWFIVPNLMTSLAFTNRGPAFISQGGFCSLPVRPIWYRLALSWIPRYLIWIYVMCVAITIYRHVGYEFKVFGQENDMSSSAGIPGQDGSPSATSPAVTMDGLAMQRGLSSQSDGAAVEKQAVMDDDVAPDEGGPAPKVSSKHSGQQSVRGAKGSDRRQSVPNWASPFGNAVFGNSDGGIAVAPMSRSVPSSRRGSRQVAPGVGAEDFAPPPAIELQRPRGSVSTTASAKSGGAQSSLETPSPGLEPITEHKTAVSSAPSAPTAAANRAMQQRRKAIQRQLRLLFIYPVAYMILWIFPFAAHAMAYSNYFAQNPVFAITVLSVFCQNIMGFCDVCIFCWREKPWRHIPGSDGTFFGSFLFWRYAFSPKWVDEARRKSTFFDSPKQEKQNSGEEDTSQSGLLGPIKRWSRKVSLTGKGDSQRPSIASMGPATTPTTPRRAPPMHRRTHSGGSDRRVLQAERAHERLAMERADWHNNRRSLQERRASAISAHEQRAQPERKEWWDRQADDLNDDMYE